MPLTNHLVDFLIILEQYLQTEFMEVSKVEEDFWPMKARISRLVEGDRNTAFYHAFTLVFRRRNRITCMKDRMGN